MSVTHTAALATSTAGLLLSLASALPRDARALERRARAVAARLGRPHGRALDHRASDLLAQLLTVADGDLDGFAEPDVLDAEFDAW